jgi:hypothetical protein
MTDGYTPGDVELVTKSVASLACDRLSVGELG